MESANGSVDRARESNSCKVEATGPGYQFTGVSRIQDEAPTSCASGGPRTVQSLEQVPGNPCCDTSGKLLLKGFNSHTGWATLLKRYYAFRSPRCLVGMQTLLHRVWEGTRDAGCIADSSWVIFNFIYF